jgi:hypothetical protein
MKKQDQIPTSSIHLIIELNFPKSLMIGINQEYVQEAIKMLLWKNPQALIGNSPEEIYQKLVLSGTNNESDTSTSKGKWAKVIENLQKNAMGKEAAEEFNQGRQKFRETFAIGDTLNNDDQQT